MTHPRCTQRDIDEARAIADQVLDRLVGDESILEQFGAAVENLAKYQGRELAIVQRLRYGRQIGPVEFLIEKLFVRAQVAAAVEAAMLEAAAVADIAAFAPRVRTSNPDSVTRIVCSH